MYHEGGIALRSRRRYISATIKIGDDDEFPTYPVRLDLGRHSGAGPPRPKHNEEAPATAKRSEDGPTFMVRALRDPDGANLDRVQIIKGWLGADGKTRERIYDVAVSDGRTIGADGRCKTPVGTTIDVANASYTNSIGDALLMGYWKDPDFDPGERAFYYVRVIEIPTPRWTAYDAKRFGIEMPEEVTMTVKDRAYTSPIWYTP